MPSKAKHKRSPSGHKDFATKNTMNPIGHNQGAPEDQTREPEAQDPERRIGQFSGEGEPPLMKK